LTYGDARGTGQFGTGKGRQGDADEAQLLDGLKLLNRGVDVVQADRRHASPARGRVGAEVGEPPVVCPVSRAELVIVGALTFSVAA